MSFHARLLERDRRRPRGPARHAHHPGLPARRGVAAQLPGLPARGLPPRAPHGAAAARLQGGACRRAALAARRRSTSTSRKSRATTSGSSTTSAPAAAMPRPCATAARATPPRSWWPMPTTPSRGATRWASSAWSTCSKAPACRWPCWRPTRSRSRCGLPDAAFSYLRSHGTLDQEHTAHFALLMDRIEDAAGPGRHRACGARLLPALWRCVPQPAAAADSASAPRTGVARMKAGEARVLLTGASGGIGRAVAARLLGGRRVGDAGRPLAGAPGRAGPRARCATAPGRAKSSGTPPTWPARRASPARRGGRGLELQRAGAQRRRAGLRPPRDAGAADDARRCCSTNLLAPMLLTQALLPHLRSLPRGAGDLRRLGAGRASACRASASTAPASSGCAALPRRCGVNWATRACACSTSARAARAPPSTAPRSRPTTAPPARRWTAPERGRARAAAPDGERGPPSASSAFPRTLAVRLNGLAPGLLDGAFVKHRRSLPDRLPTRPST